MKAIAIVQHHHESAQKPAQTLLLPWPNGGRTLNGYQKAAHQNTTIIFKLNRKLHRHNDTAESQIKGVSSVIDLNLYLIKTYISCEYSACVSLQQVYSPPKRRLLPITVQYPYDAILHTSSQELHQSSNTHNNNTNKPVIQQQQ